MRWRRKGVISEEIAKVTEKAVVVVKKANYRRHVFLMNLDEEKITSWQWFYYPMIVFAGVYLWLGADEPTKVLIDNLGPHVYEGWLTLNIVPPVMTLVGRRLYAKAATYPEGAPNPGYGAALLQLWGDLGVWSAILIYALCTFNTTEWGQPLYATFYFAMGIPGGFLFSLRSWRRLREIHKLERGLS